MTVGKSLKKTSFERELLSSGGSLNKQIFVRLIMLLYCKLDKIRFKLFAKVNERYKHFLMNTKLENCLNIFHETTQEKATIL